MVAQLSAEGLQAHVTQATDGVAAQPDASAPPPPPVLPPPPLVLPPGSDAATRELAAAAQRYAAAAATNPSDYESVYNHGLALQELASRVGGSAPQQFQLLSQACERYEAACALRSSSHAALYNHGVALSDLARHIWNEDQEAAQQYLLASAAKYGESLRWNPNNPQALNNWGLVLQELTVLRPASERDFLVSAAAVKFRRAIRLRPEFDRAAYNLGTVFYSHAVAQQNEAEDSHSTASSEASQHGLPGERERGEASVRAAFQLAAQYIALAQALQPSKDVYRKSLQVLRQVLPLPYLRVGHLLAVEHGGRGEFGSSKAAPEAAGTASDAPGRAAAWQQPLDERWHRAWFVLDADSFRTVADPQRQSAGSAAEAEYIIPLGDMRCAKAAADPSLPEGPALWLQLSSHPQGLYFVAANDGDANGWIDALCLAGHLAAVGRLASLRQSLRVAERGPNAAPPSTP